MWCPISQNMINLCCVYALSPASKSISNRYRINYNHVNCIHHFVWRQLPWQTHFFNKIKRFWIEISCFFFFFLKTLKFLSFTDVSLSFISMMFLFGNKAFAVVQSRMSTFRGFGWTSLYIKLGLVISIWTSKVPILLKHFWPD